MNCKICKHNTVSYYKGKVLTKYDVNYFQCEKCKFIQTEFPHWLEEAYSSAITKLDIGLLSRNLYLTKEIPKIINNCFPEAKTFIDYGGGYGVFVRLMRDLGYDFYRYDIYCENIFANYFDLNDAPSKKFDVLTAFEVFEHLDNPIGEIEKMFGFSDTIIFSTLLLNEESHDFSKWWYVSAETGQHIAFYDKNTLVALAKLFNCNVYSNNYNLHILTKNTLTAADVKKVFQLNKPSRLKNLKFFKENKQMRKSLIETDLEKIKYLINSK